MAEVRITTKPPLPGARVEFRQNDELVAERDLDAGGSLTGEVELDERETVELRVGDRIKTHQIPRDLGNLRFMTKEKPRLSIEEATRRWKRAEAGLPKDWLDESLPEKVLHDRKDAIGREAFGEE